MSRARSLRHHEVIAPTPGSVLATLLGLGVVTPLVAVVARDLIRTVEASRLSALVAALGAFMLAGVALRVVGVPRCAHAGCGAGMRTAARAATMTTWTREYRSCDRHHRRDRYRQREPQRGHRLPPSSRLRLK